MPWSHSGQGSIIIAVQEGKRWDWHLSSPVHSLSIPICLFLCFVMGLMMGF
jgi:hypothetical protein